ncbi:hypothetical protein HY025_03140 [Candidatus Daviesbacteria bacterium]|nr:hypothetical protein [Candidatus Daviesbacteria bacterium]
MLKVQKRDGTLEDFDKRKVVIGVLKAGATNAEAEKLASEIEAYCHNIAIHGAIKSQEIRTRVLETLKTSNPTLGGSFEFYRKPS